jgi:hypothetical protein
MNIKKLDVSYNPEFKLSKDLDSKGFKTKLTLKMAFFLNIFFTCAPSQNIRAEFIS